MFGAQAASSLLLRFPVLSCHRDFPKPALHRRQLLPTADTSIDTTNRDFRSGFVGADADADATVVNNQEAPETPEQVRFCFSRKKEEKRFSRAVIRFSGVRSIAADFVDTGKKFVCFVFFVFLFRTCRRLARRCSAARTVRPSTTRSGIPTTSRPTTASTTDTCSTSLTTLHGGSTCPDQTR